MIPDLAIKQEYRQYIKEPHMDKLVKALKKEPAATTRRHFHATKHYDEYGP